LIPRKDCSAIDLYAGSVDSMRVSCAMVTYKTILVLLEQAGEPRHRVRIAVDLARSFSAGLVGVYLSTSPEITPSVAALLPDEIVDRYLRGSGDVQYAAERAFREAAAQAEWRDVEWRSPSGPPLDAAVAHGRCADLIVVGQPQVGEAASLFSSQLASAVLMETGRPLLVVPYVGAPARLGDNVLVAWDGGREASRAVADAMPLLRRAGRVTVGCFDPGASDRGADTAGRARLTEYLRRHGITVEIDYTRLGPIDIPVGEWLLSRVADLGCDLVVMGGYAHPRWREQVLGGATRTLLSSMTVPVLMSH
jgi:nucleotide-binding universal stress UspA family protein